METCDFEIDGGNLLACLERLKGILTEKGYMNKSPSIRAAFMRLHLSFVVLSVPLLHSYAQSLFVLLNGLISKVNENADSAKILIELNAACDLVNGIKGELSNKSFKYTTFNSDAFYTKQIDDIKKDKISLEEEIEKLRSQQSEKEAESEGYKIILQKKEEELQKYITLTKEYEIEQKEQEKIKDAINVWENKIKAAFTNLKTYIQPIKEEYSRLEFLYKSYFTLAALLVLVVAFIEIMICCKIVGHEKIPTWEEYFSLILPIPISLVLLWGFIHEMNRAQRQLVILAKQIHEIEYVEGILLTINKLSTNIEDSMNRVNSAINKLLENHLNYKDETLHDEVLLKKEELKDPILYKETLNLMKEIKGLLTLNK